MTTIAADPLAHFREIVNPQQAATMFDFLNSRASDERVQRCVPREYYPPGHPPGSQDKSNAAAIIAQADSGYAPIGA